MSTSYILEWAVWANLDRQQSWELILLKGHLLIESVLIETHSRLVLVELTKTRNLSFHRKVQDLKQSQVDDKLFNDALNFAFELNDMRNKLAHEAFVDGLEQDFNSLSSRILLSLPTSKFQKYTTRTKSTQAMATLAKVLNKQLS